VRSAEERFVAGGNSGSWVDEGWRGNPLGRDLRGRNSKGGNLGEKMVLLHM